MSSQLQGRDLVRGHAARNCLIVKYFFNKEQKNKASFEAQIVNLCFKILNLMTLDELKALYDAVAALVLCPRTAHSLCRNLLTTFAA